MNVAQIDLDDIGSIGDLGFSIWQTGFRWEGLKPEVRTLEVQGREYPAVTFFYPDESLDSLVSTIKRGDYRKLQKDYSPLIVEHCDYHPRRSMFIVRRFEVAVLEAESWLMIGEETTFSWCTEVANWDDPGDIGDGIHESSETSKTRILGPVRACESTRLWASRRIWESQRSSEARP